GLGAGFCRALGLGILRPRRGPGLVGLDRRGARLEPEPVRLADHRVARNTAEFVGDLARGRAALPHLGQRSDTFVGPAHSNSICSSGRPISGCRGLLPALPAADSRAAWPTKSPPYRKAPASRKNSSTPSRVPGGVSRPRGSR